MFYRKCRLFARRRKLLKKYVTELSCQSTKKYNKAKTLLKDLSTKITDIKIHHLLGIVYFNQGRDQEANEQFQILLEEEPNSFLGYLWTGKLHYKQLMYESAEEYLNKALKLDPENSDALVTLATMYIDFKRFSDAKEFADEALANDPDNWQARLVLGKICFNTNLLDKAKQHIQFVLANDPENILAHKLMGDIKLKYKNEKDEILGPCDPLDRHYLQDILKMNDELPPEENN